MKLVIGILKYGGSYEGRDCDTRPRKRAVGNLRDHEDTERNLDEKGKKMRLKNRRGQGLVEYILIVALMGILAIAAINSLSSETQNGYSKATKRLKTEFKKI